MRQLTRPNIPPSLLTTGASEFEDARRHFEGTGRRDGFKFKAYGERDVKATLNAMAGGKCAYCEADYDVTQPSDLEHFRPKGAIETQSGRIKPGYWWLGSAWENLLPSCIRCNRKEQQPLYDGTELMMGKGNRFPLVNEGARATAVGAEAQEHPLLIDPSKEDPAAFLRFEDYDDACIAVPVDQDPASRGSMRARASIEIFGLNRAGLVRDRWRYLRRAKVSLARLQTLARRLDRVSADDPEQLDEVTELIEQELNDLGAMTSGEDRYTGILRAFIDPALAELNIHL